MSDLSIRWFHQYFDIYIRKNKIKTQFQEKNWRFIVSKFVKLSDEFIESETFDMMTG